MNAKRAMWIGMTMATLLTGCAPGVGYIIRPVAVDETLRESVVKIDRGWFVRDKIAGWGDDLRDARRANVPRRVS